MQSGYSLDLIQLLAECKHSASSFTLYYRGCKVREDHDKMSMKRTYYLNDEGDAGFIIKIDNGEYLLVEVNQRSGGLFWQKSNSFRFSVDPFNIAAVVRGKFSLTTIIDYLNKYKHRLYDETFAVKPRDFAIECMEWLVKKNKGLTYHDMREDLISRIK